MERKDTGNGLPETEVWHCHSGKEEVVQIFEDLSFFLKEKDNMSQPASQSVDGMCHLNEYGYEIQKDLP